MDRPEKPKKKSTAEKLLDAEALLDEQRLYILYLNFDIEATRRERNYWKHRATRGK